MLVLGEATKYSISPDLVLEARNSVNKIGLDYQCIMVTYSALMIGDICRVEKDYVLFRLKYSNKRKIKIFFDEMFYVEKCMQHAIGQLDIIEYSKHFNKFLSKERRKYLAYIKKHPITIKTLKVGNYV